MYRVLLFLILNHVNNSLINNRKPQANYVIPISDGESALVHCISFFSPTSFQGYAKCDNCELKHVPWVCCRKVNVTQTPRRLRCTSKIEGLREDDPNMPFIDVTVVRDNTPLQTVPPITTSAPTGNDTARQTAQTAYNDEVFFCNNQTQISLLTAGSHIGLGWTTKTTASTGISKGNAPTMAPTTKPPVTDRGSAGEFATINNNNFFNARHKENKFSLYYANELFQPLSVSEDIKVELMEHGSNFSCNGTKYYLPRGSRCMTPSARAIFIMVNCNVVERVFIVIGVIIVLVIAYVVFNMTLFLWDYIWHHNSKRKHDREPLL